MSVVLNPDKTLTFGRPLTQPVRRELTVHNPNASNVVFKVKTTAPKQYSVRPNAGIIKPNETVSVAIHFQPMKEELAPDAKCKDKFLVQSAFVPSSIMLDNPDITPQAIWGEIENNRPQESIFASKIRCAYAPLDESSTGGAGAGAQQDPSSLSQKQSVPPASNALLTPAPHDLSRNDGTMRKRKQAAEEALNGGDLDRSIASAYESPMASNYNTTNNSASSKMQSSAPGSPGSTIGGSGARLHGNNLNSSSATATALSSTAPSTAATAGSQSPQYGLNSAGSEGEIHQLRQELSQARSELAQLRGNKSSENYSPAFKQAVVAAHPSTEGVPVQVVAAIVLGVFILTWAFF